MSSSRLRPIAGIVTVIVIAAVVSVAIGQFAGRFTESVPVTVMTDRAGLLMNPGGKVKLNGAQVGTVSAVTVAGEGARIQLALDPAWLTTIPEDVHVEIGSNTVFGAKSVELTSPAQPSRTHLAAGQVLSSEHVTVETNTIFEDLNTLLAHIDPVKLNETLGAVSTAFSGRGESFGQSLSDLNSFLGEIEPSLPTLGRELQTFSDVSTAYADAAPDLMATVRNVTGLGQTLIDKHDSLDRLLVSAIGLADIGTEVIGGNREPLTNLTRLMVPTTDLTNEYHEALTCALTGVIDFVRKPPAPVPGVYDLGALTLGLERYRYPQDLPKVAANGPQQCNGQLPLQFNVFPPHVVADVGIDKTRYGNQGLLLNSDALKQYLFGPIDGPPRNSAQWGQPG